MNQGESGMDENTQAAPASPKPKSEHANGGPLENGALGALYHMVKKVVIAVIGVTVIVAGVAMLILPGPGMVTIIVGVGILATEFVWAANVYRRIRRGARTAWDAFVPEWLSNRLPKWMRLGRGRRQTPAAK